MSLETGWETHSWMTAHGLEVPGDPGRVIRQCRLCKRAFLIDDTAPGKTAAIYLGPFHIDLMPPEVNARWMTEACPREIDPTTQVRPTRTA
jgi:hypothetical protein